MDTNCALRTAMPVYIYLFNCRKSTRPVINLPIYRTWSIQIRCVKYYSLFYSCPFSHRHMSYSHCLCHASVWRIFVTSSEAMNCGIHSYLTSDPRKEERSFKRARRTMAVVEAVVSTKHRSLELNHAANPFVGGQIVKYTQHACKQWNSVELVNGFSNSGLLAW